MQKMNNNAGETRPSLIGKMGKSKLPVNLIISLGVSACPHIWPGPPKGLVSQSKASNN